MWFNGCLMLLNIVGGVNHNGHSNCFAMFQQKIIGIFSVYSVFIVVNKKG